MVLSVLLRRNNFMKYNYFIKYYLNNRNRKTAFFIDGAKSSFNSIGISFPFFSKTIIFFELLLWMAINKINPFKNKIYFDIKKLDPKNDVLVDFAYSVVSTNKKNIQSNKFEGIVLKHCTHYFQNTREISDYLSTIKNCIAVAENDLLENGFFRKCFPFINNTYQLPFSFGDRFVVRRDFDSRINKCVALGTPCLVTGKEFIDFFKSDVLHPMRKTIRDRHADFPDEIDSMINNFKAATDIKKINKRDSFIQATLKKILPGFILEKILPNHQKDYFKFDIVDKYNEYKMFVCPEELTGLPSVNVFEGMACKCAFIGIDDPMYTNLGLVPGVHYISYEQENLTDLVDKIKYYQNNTEELKRIAENGYQFVINNLNKKKIADLFWGDFEKISKNFSQSGKVKISCSFKSGKTLN